MKKQYDLNGDIGGPIVKQKAWFFTSWRFNDKYTYITGLGDEIERSKLSNRYTFKGTFQVGRNNQIIGYLNKREKLQDKRGISLTTPLSAAYYQSSRNYPWKVGMDQRARQPRVPRRALRQLVQLLPAAPGPRLRPL